VIKKGFLMSHFIGIEGGGTKFVCVHGNHPQNLQDRIVIKTETPELTLKKVIQYIKSIKTNYDIKAIGMAVFGPLDLDIHSHTYGYITTTPKTGWNNYNIVGTLKKHFNLPIGFDTDVNGAALGEHRWGAAHGVDDFVYLTVGTGIGGGIMINGKVVHGAMHPEIGHMLIPQDISRDSFSGVCQYHKNCMESLASGTAMSSRWQVDSAIELPLSHEAWDLEAHYLGIGIANLITVFSPKMVILGGGIMQQNHLLPKIRKEVIKSLNCYIQFDKMINHIDKYIVSPGLNEDSGVCGAIALAQQSLLKSSVRNMTINSGENIQANTIYA
jgi:fructokinase